MTDLYEVKAAVLAAKENSDKPVFVTMTFETNHRTFTGCSVDAMCAVLEGLGVDALGVNCLLGPEELYPIVKKMCELTALPLIRQGKCRSAQSGNGGIQHYTRAVCSTDGTLCTDLAYAIWRLLWDTS